MAKNKVRVKPSSRGSAKTATTFAKAKSYVGLKQINAIPMTKGAYNKFRGWELPEDENGKDKGYLVEYLNGSFANTKQFKWYVSWSPAEQFDNAYMANGSMSFGAAVYLMKKGFKLARKGWNGKKMWIILVPGTTNAKIMRGTPYAKAGLTNGQDIGAHVDMMTATGVIQPGWLCSQNDMLSEDWLIVS